MPSCSPGCICQSSWSGERCLVRSCCYQSFPGTLTICHQTIHPVIHCIPYSLSLTVNQFPLTHSLIHSLIQSFVPALIHSLCPIFISQTLVHSCIHSFIQTLTYSVIQSCIHAFCHACICSLMKTLTSSLIPLLTEVPVARVIPLANMACCKVPCDGNSRHDLHMKPAQWCPVSASHRHECHGPAT